MKQTSKRKIEVPHTTVIKELVLKFPTTPNMTLAKKFVKDYPEFMLSVEHARALIRQLKGKSGEKNREAVHKDFRVEFEKALAKLKKELPKGETERKEPYVLPKANRNVLIISDLHIPYQDDAAVFAALEYGAAQNVDTIIINGDLIDFALISRHEKDLRKRSVAYEIETAKIFLQGLRAMFRNSLIIYKFGNHCFTVDTEILTTNGFVKFPDLKEDDMVAQFDENRNISYSKPNAIIKRMYEGDIYDISNNYTRQVVTDKHRVLIGNEFVEARDVKVGDVKKVPTNGYLNNEEYDISDNMLRFIVWLVCDGCIVLDKKYQEKKMRFQFKLSKERKIETLIKLLDELGAPYTYKLCKKSGVNKLQPYYIRIYKRHFVSAVYEMINSKKQFPQWFNKLSKRQAEIVLNELVITDGSIHDGGITWTTTSLNDCSVIQEMCILNGIKANFKNAGSRKSGFANGKEQYRSRIKIDSDNSMIISNSITTKPYNDMVYCVEMPLGTVITRNDGRVAFTGNCSRFHKWIMQKAPELLDIEGTSLPEILGLRALNIVYVEDKRYIYAGKMAIFHGHEVGMTSGGVNPARTLRLKLNKSAITSHFHRETKDMGRNLDEHPYACYSTGALCDLFPAYMPINQWTHGFIHLTLGKDGSYKVQQKSIIDGVIY
jgi:hypothetical protein